MNPNLISYTAQAQRALDDIFVYQELTGALASEGLSISLGVTLIENGRWVMGDKLKLNWDGSVTDMNDQNIGSWGAQEIKPMAIWLLTRLRAGAVG